MARAEIQMHEYTEITSDGPAKKSYRNALVGGNGEPLMWSEPYPTVANAERGAKDARKAMRFAKIVRKF